MNKILKTLVLSLGLSACMATAAFADTGAVEMSLESSTDSSAKYMPNAHVDYSLVLTNSGGDAWVRLSYQFANYGTDLNLSDEYMEMNDGWVLINGYWYYTEEVPTGTVLDICDGFTIPDISNAEEGAYLNIKATGEGISTYEFVPDFDSDDPWDGWEGDVETVTTSTSTKKSSGTGNSSGGSITTTTLYRYSTPGDSSSSKSTGSWEYNAVLNQWKYKDSQNNYATNGWYYIYNPYTQDGTDYSWFHFDENSVMSTGWVKMSETDWYYTYEVSDGNLGMLIKGWMTDDQDGATYFLDRTTGLMHYGLDTIDGNTYYFATLDDIPQQTWFWDTTIGGWIYEMLGYRSYGSMYAAEMIPSGATADEYGMIH